jgi:hypothetical protein
MEIIENTTGSSTTFLSSSLVAQAQTFTAVDAFLVSVSVKVSNLYGATSGTIGAYLVDTSSGAPVLTATPIISDDSYDAADIASGGSQLDFNFNSRVVIGTVYAFIILRTVTTDQDMGIIFGDDTYSSGTRYYFDTSWHSQANDLWFILKFSDKPLGRISRKNQKIFCGEVPYNGVLAQFGSLKGTLPNYSSDPDIIQALPAWGDGWASAVINNYLPTIQDLNSLIYVITRQIAYLFQAGIPEWNSLTTYYIGSMVSDGLGGIYKSVVNNNINASLTNSNYWLNFSSIKKTEIGANYTVLNADYFIIWSLASTTSTERTVTLPTPAASLKGREVVVKAFSPTGAYPIRVVTADASKINFADYYEIAQYKGSVFYCDGNRWVFIS